MPDFALDFAPKWMHVLTPYPVEWFVVIDDKAFELIGFGEATETGP